MLNRVSGVRAVRLTSFMVVLSLSFAGAGIRSGTAKAATAGADTSEAEMFAAELGVSLQEARTVLETTPDVGALARVGEAVFPQRYAGLHRAPGRGGVITVHVKGSSADLAEEFRRQFRRPELLEFVPAQYTLTELRDVEKSVGDRVEAGFDVSAWYVDVVANRVTIEIPPGDTATADALADEYGAAVRIVFAEPAVHPVGEAQTTDESEEIPTDTVVNDTSAQATSCNSRQDCGPQMRGGVLISNGTHLCTSGFEGRISTRSVLLTAGHCFAVNDAIIHGAVAVGQVQQRQFRNLGNNDGAQLSQTQGLFPTVPWQPSNWMYRDNNTKTYAITSVAPLFSEQVGDYICRSGIKSGRQCGNIMTVNYNQTINTDEGTVQLAGQVRASFCSLPGDSGGPVYNSGRGHGMNSSARFRYDSQGRPACYPVGDANRWSTFSPLRRSIEAFNVVVRTTAP